MWKVSRPLGVEVSTSSVAGHDGKDELALRRRGVGAFLNDAAPLMARTAAVQSLGASDPAFPDSALVLIEKQSAPPQHFFNKITHFRRIATRSEKLKADTESRANSVFFNTLSQ